MTIGTKSVLFGAHCFFLHPFFVALGWWRLYGFPWDPRLWIAFFVHDLGYIGLPNMDGPEGEAHPQLGALIMSELFDGPWKLCRTGLWQPYVVPWLRGETLPSPPIDNCRPFDVGPWGLFSLLHSRYYAKTLGLQPSRLCMADKLAIALTPAWLYLPMVNATGEIKEYMAHATHRAQGNTHVTAEELDDIVSASQRRWYSGVQSYCYRWALQHRDGAVDTWTSDARNRATVGKDGAWK